MVTQSDVPDAVRKSRVSSLAEWRAAGLTDARLRSLVRSGDLVRVWHGVCATRSAVEWAKASPARGHALFAMAVRVSVGRDSVASHQSAALIHGLDLFPHPPDVVILTRPPARRSGRRKSDGIFFHTAELPDDHVTRALGAKVTTVARTVVDIARASSFMSAVVTADSALHAALASEEGASFTTKETLLAACDACAGWPGIRQARRAIDFADPRAESVLESCARVVFHEHGLEPPELQFTITGPDFRYSVDFYWPRYRVIAEADGEVKYSDPRRAIRQLERDQQLRDHGDKVVHFTWRELFKAPQAVTNRICNAFASPTPV
jgi:very-short-patch-repair endonuclease